jgi:hypothetical protein
VSFAGYFRQGDGRPQGLENLASRKLTAGAKARSQRPSSLQEKNVSRFSYSIVFIGCLVTAGLLSSCGSTGSGAAYKNPSTPVEQRVEDLLGRMTVEEKAAT